MADHSQLGRVIKPDKRLVGLGVLTAVCLATATAVLPLSWTTSPLSYVLLVLIYLPLFASGVIHTPMKRRNLVVGTLIASLTAGIAGAGVLIHGEFILHEGSPAGYSLSDRLVDTVRHAISWGLRGGIVYLLGRLVERTAANAEIVYTRVN